MMAQQSRKHVLLLVWMVVCHMTKFVTAEGAHTPRFTLGLHLEHDPLCPSHKEEWRRRHATVNLDLRGGGRGPSSPSAVPSHPLSASGERLASAWQNDILPRMQALREQLTARMEGRSASGVKNSPSRLQRASANNNRHWYSTSTTTSDATDKISAATASSLLVPSRIFKLTLLALLLAEGLDRVGVLYEDAPALLRSRLDDLWCYHLLPKLIRCKERCQLFYWNRVEPLLPNAIIYSDFYNAPLSNLSLHALSTTKVAFAIGATVGMLSSPLLAQGAIQHWKPILAIYGLAEVNHYCTRRGQKFVHWLGETPQTLGATLNGILNQVRNLVRRILLGEKHVDEYGGGYFGVNANNRLTYPGNSRLSLLGGGDDNTRSSKRSLRHKSGDEESDFQMLLDDFKEWMVANAPQRHDAVPSLLPSFGPRTVSESEEKRQFATKGFLIGCGIGLAFFRV